MAISLRRALHPLGPVGAQACAQAISLGTQLVLIALLGQAGFADLGLGLAGAMSVGFLGELGLGTYFLRASASPQAWLDPWREAVCIRLLSMAVVGVLVWMALGWAAPSPEISRTVLLAAIPGLVATSANPLPILFGLGRVRLASGSVLLRAMLQGGIGLSVTAWHPDWAAAGLGIGFSLGVLAQLLFGRIAGLPRVMMLPRLPRALPPLPAIRLWGLAVVGTMSDRTLPFLIADLRPQILAPALILLQVLQGLAGMAGQLDRLIIPAAAHGAEPRLILRSVLPALALISVIMLAALPVLAWTYFPGQAMAAFLLGVEWAMVATGALAFALAFGRATESGVAWFMLTALPLSILAQIFLAPWIELEGVLILRILVAAVASWLAMRCLRETGHA